MQGVDIIDLDVVKHDERGTIFEFPNRDTSKLLLVKRKKGTISGKHYHSGANKMKDPETLVIIDGELEMILHNVKTGEHFSAIYNRPVICKIAPFIYHEIRAITDIIMLDMNGIADDDDTIKMNLE